MSIKKAALIVALAVALAPAAALADSFIDFGVGPGGTISYAGGAAPMVGSAIPVGDVTSSNTPSNSGVTLTVDFGSMDYTTGAYDAGTSIPGSVWNFGTGGTISVTGCIPGVTAASCTGLNNVTLLSGSFVLPEPTAGAAGMFASIADTKNSSLLAFYGVSRTSFLGSVNQNFNAFSSNPLTNSFTAGGAAGDTLNDVPEPASLALVGSGLVGLAGLVRRKLFS